MAGSITVSRHTDSNNGVAISIGSGWYTLVVNGARSFFPPGTEHFIEKIYGAGDEGGEDWADLRDLPADGFNAFYVAIRRSIELQARDLYDNAGKQRPNQFGTETDEEIVRTLEADSRFDCGYGERWQDGYQCERPAAPP